MTRKQISRLAPAVAGIIAFLLGLNLLFDADRQPSQVEGLYVVGGGLCVLGGCIAAGLLALSTALDRSPEGVVSAANDPRA